MKQTLSQEQINRFAEAVGWSRLPEINGDDREVWRDPHGARRDMPDFLHSKDAVLEALEHFTTSAIGQGCCWLVLRRLPPGPMYECLMELPESPRVLIGKAKGETLNEAIIEAVLSALPSTLERNKE